jgi:hypothetical protein
MQANEIKSHTKNSSKVGYFGGASSFAIEKKYFEDLQLAMSKKAKDDGVKK